MTAGAGRAVDHLEEGRNALFVPARSPADLARALARLLNDDALRADIGENNRQKVESFAPAAAVPRYVAIMRSLMEEDPEGHVRG